MARRPYLLTAALTAFAGAGAVAPVIVSAAPASAEAGKPAALCTFQVRDTPSPGWLITPTKGTSAAKGTMTCHGSLDGKQLAGKPGPFTWVYSYDSADVPAGGNTCALAGGHGTWEASLPTTDGTSMTLTGPWTWMGTVEGKFSGQFGSHPVEGIYETYAPSDHPMQDCIMNPTGDLETPGQAMIG